MKAELNPFWKHLTLGPAIGAMLLATSVAGVAEAQPASMPIAPMLNPTERVITISDQDVPLAATRYRSVMSKGVVDVKGEDVPLPAGVKLLPGEVVRINYRNGVAVHEAKSGTCTATATVRTPTSANSAESLHSYYRGSGCSTSAYIRGALWANTWLGMSLMDSLSVTVKPGHTTWWGTSKRCAGFDATTWYAETGWPAIVSSPDVTLKCNP